MHLPGTVCSFHFEHREFRFFVQNPRDLIQKHHRKGGFYEVQDLDLIRRTVGPGTICADIGSNVGNHAIFFSEVMQAEKVYVFEPNPVARHILELNILLNAATRIDTSYIRYGMSNRHTTGVIETPRRNNLGGSQFKSDDSGEIVVLRGDDILRKVGFLKIDVEGAEMDVLAGLEQTIRICRPIIYIEVDNVNADAFLAWVEQSGYRISDRIKRYAANENFMLIPG